MKVFTLLIPLFLLEIATFSQEVVRNTFLLNGTWQFEQTLTAFPPSNFSRTIPVPGLIHLADPRIEEYDVFFKKPDQVEKKQQHNLQDIDYTPRYSWYRKKVFIPKDLKGKEAVLTIKKSQYVTQVYINGWDAGGSMACYTPIDLNITSALKYGEENEILIRIGDRIWLPSEAAGSTDKEKEHYLPGIWDDVLLSFTGKIRLHRVLVLPSLKNENINIKAQIRNYYPAQLFYGDPMHDNVEVGVVIKEKKTGKAITSTSEKFEVKRDNLTEISIQIPVEDIHPWSVEDPFLYTAEVLIKSKNENNDKVLQSFGIRDFERRGRYFYLNDKRIILRGTNITLQRFFEDPECGNLAWDREWVKSLLIDASKELNWNMMRICVGIVPDFWYDIADENGLMFQNEWFYWQNHGWDAQVRKEYQDWIWSDGNHPSIVIWDAINENWDSYIGNTLIPDLMKLDPTRIWDAGYMTGSEMNIDEMDEPHPYDGVFPRTNIEAYEKKPYPLGDLNYMNKTLKASIESGAAQLVNEYGWIWLWRDGRPSKLTVNAYNYLLHENSSPQENRHLQAYWLQLETEWLRSHRSLAGVLAFCHLTNNYGYTGDWYIGNIKDLVPGPTLHWFKHAFNPVAVFINIADERYLKQVSTHHAGETMNIDLVGINDYNTIVNGWVKLSIFDHNGKETVLLNREIVLPTLIRETIPVSFELPRQEGGYLMVASFKPQNSQNDINVLSRRYIKIGDLKEYKYFEIKP